MIAKARKGIAKNHATIPKMRERGTHAADHATYAAFWRRWLAQLDVGFISRGGSAWSACYGVPAVFTMCATG